MCIHNQLVGLGGLLTLNYFKLIFFPCRTTVGDWLDCLFKLCLLNTMLWVISGLVDAIDEPVSRRLANLPYVLWMVSTLFGLSLKHCTL